MPDSKTTEALIYLARVRERELAEYVDDLKRTANLRFWHYGHGWRPWAKARLPRAERELTEIRRHLVSLEHRGSENG